MQVGARRATPPPLYLSIIPGPLVTVTPPLVHDAVRVPLAASGLVALPLLLVGHAPFNWSWSCATSR